MRIFDNSRTVRTGLYGDTAFEVIDKVHGQMSDGMWENSPSYEKYWINFIVKRLDDGEVAIEVNAASGEFYCRRWYANPFTAMSDKEVKAFLAKKIKAVAMQELKDRCIGAWNRRNEDSKSIYLGGYGAVVSIADIYCVYEALLGREIGVAKYDSSTIGNVFGQKRTDEETMHVKTVREMKASIEAKYAKLRADAEAAKKEAIKKIEDEYVRKLTELNKQRCAEIDAMSM